MSEKSNTDNKQEGPSMGWEEMTQNFWNPILQQWRNLYNQAENQEEQEQKGRVTETLASNLKMWQTMVAALTGPDAINQFQKATEMTPDLALGFAQSCLQSLNGLQSQAVEWIAKRGENLSEADIQELDRELLKNWRETYEQEFSRYLKIPQIGLNRLYQERGLNAVDKMNSFQLELSGFLQILYMPIEKSLKALQDEMTNMAETGSIDERSKTYYNLWVKSMEGHYMELFQQEDYSDAMHKTLFTLHEFSKAKNEVINDILKQINIPNNKDFDELSKEIYLLKKRVRALERK